jgi:Ser/Thr protein kinase RdoA (MazF antagonist)
MEEIPLEGGNVADGVVRVGDTVRRPVGEWTPAVHALLRHLEAAGFDSAPRVLGIDEKGREVLSYCEGVSLSLELPHLLASLDGVARAGVLVARLHDALRTFHPDADAQWWRGSVDPLASATVIHGDLAPWNTIVNGDAWSIIDWDSAGPGRFVWEAAYSLHTFGMLWPDAGFSDKEVVARIRAFGDGAQLTSAALADVLRLVPARTDSIAEMIDRLASEGHPAFTRHQQEGHPQVWRAASMHVAERLPEWLAGLGRPNRS